MNFIGIGPIEIIVILTVAVIILGPEKIIQTIKNSMKIYKEIISYINGIEKINLNVDTSESIHSDETTFNIKKIETQSIESDKDKTSNH